MNHTEAAQYIKATLTAFGPGEAISMTKETWAKIHEAMQVLAQPEQEPSELDIWKSRALQAEAVVEKFMAQPEQHQDWCASLTQMLASMPPKQAPCNCKPAQPEQEPVAWETFALKFANGKGLSYKKPKNLPKYLACRPLIYAPVPTSDTSEKRVDETAKQRHEPEPVIDKSAAIRIATSLGWEPKRTWLGLTDEEMDTEADKKEQGYGFIQGALWAEDKLKEKNT